MDSSENTGSSTNSKCQYFCSYADCNALFSKRKKLLSHILKHTGERPFKCDEPNCEKTYTNSSHLNRHKLSHKPKEQPQIKCPIEGCTWLLSNQNTLKKHCLRMHNPNRYVCSDCQMNFNKKKQLLNHINNEHNKQYVSTTCNVCNLTFSTKSDCNRHKRTHTKYSCKCLQEFERWSELVKHKNTCVILKTCSICNKSFVQRSNLARHMKVHEEERDTLQCPYENCPRYYFYKKNLQWHIDTYHLKLPKVKSQFCPYCEDKKFTQKNHLKNHITKVHNIEPKIPKKPAARKDTGTMKRSTAIKLTGLIVPIAMEKKIIEGEDINIVVEYINEENELKNQNTNTHTI